MIVVRTRDSRLFEEAYFVMRRDMPDTAHNSGDILWEANRIIERNTATPHISDSTRQTNSMYNASNTRQSKIKCVLFFIGGILCGGGGVLLVSLWL